ncbi:MAG: hypothetical protein KBD53_08575 [Candidatus Omnitrophica bacterium]|nr:hypothetical protein [Candidatus Omnitrophota bacterium]
MDYIIDVVKGDLGRILFSGQFMLSSLFLLAVVTQYLGVIQHKDGWTGLLLRLTIGFILLQNYTWLMDTTRVIVEGVDVMINPDQSFINQYATMSDNLRQEYEANVQKSITSQILNFGKNTIHNLIINLSFIFYAVISKIMEAIRYSITAILYKLGPVLIPLILFNSTKRVLSGWFTSYVSVLAWPILWHITLAIAVAISRKIGLTGDGIEYFVALNFAVGFILISSPMIISSLAAGVGAGAAASLAGAFASKSAIDTLRQGTRLSLAGSGGAVRGGLQSAQNIKQDPLVNPTLTERLKNVMSSVGKVSMGTISGGIKSVAYKTGFKPSVIENNALRSIRNVMKGKKNE